MSKLLVSVILFPITAISYMLTVVYIHVLFGMKAAIRHYTVE